MIKRIAIHAINAYDLVSARIHLATAMRNCSSFEAVMFLDMTRDRNNCRLIDNAFKPTRS